MACKRPASASRSGERRVRRAVWKRDGGRCQFRLASGEICASTLRVEIFRLVYGRIVEEWNSIDELGLRRQLGAIP